MNISNAYLAFNDYGETIYVSIAEILNSGIPIYGDGKYEGEEMDMISGDIFHQIEGKFVKTPCAD